MISKKKIYLISLFVLLHVLLVNSNVDIRQLPHCMNDRARNTAVIVGTLDGKLSALNSEGSLLWSIETGPGPLLISNIHKLELNNNGQLIRIIPSLTGSLYKFDGQNIDSIPINAENLLKSSFLYSDDLVLAGGRELRTYGVGFKSGNLLYECSFNGCQNKTDFETENEDTLIIERTTITVRAHEPRSGTERWNFSVGLHNIKLPQISCLDTNNFIDFDLNVIVPKGFVIASLNNKDIWKHQFKSPIVTVWKWNGEELQSVNLFDQKSLITSDIAALYLGMHNKQLYIHESDLLLNVLPSKDLRTITSIPWKPVSAAGITALSNSNNQQTGLSVLQSSEYVNGNGFYFYLEKEFLCKNGSEDEEIFEIPYFFFDVVPLIIQFAIVIIVTVITWKFNFKKQKETAVISTCTDETTLSVRSKTNSESSETAPFHSRFASDFETVRTLGRGGFGIVFEVRRNLDECCYAIKRITLPKEHNSKEKVMREVKTLAKLDHQNIVRYYNSWVETPPVGWCKEHDEKFMSNSNEPFSYTTTTSNQTHRRSASTVIDIEKDHLANDDFDSENQLTESNSDDSHEILFEDTNPDSCNKISTVASIIVEKQQNRDVNPVFLYIQMQLCQKKSLKDWLLENQKRNYSAVLNIFSQILDAVEYIHKNGLIHRDLKPSNIFFSLEGNIKVGDFGLVTGMEDDLDSGKQNLSISVYQSHTRGVGTQLYMSPEQRDGKKYNYKVDIWSLGIIFFELLQPFSTEMERTKILSDLRSNIYPNSFLDNFAEESDILKGMLCHEPDKRPNTSHIKSRPIFYSNYKNI